MTGTRWVIVDTETDGLYEPVHVVELAGQLMEGWEAVGEPFRMLLNHDVPIHRDAFAIHGYTQEYLRRNGQEPTRVYELFRDYARDYPIVAHNLSFDWNRCLEPEWSRLGVPRIGQRGFCCMMLARRLAPETHSYRLDVLKQCFQLKQTQGHQALNDVLTVVELFQQVYKPRLEFAGLDTFDLVAGFSTRRPVAKCLDIIRGASVIISKPKAAKDEWYFLDASSNPHGPLPARLVSQNSGLETYYVWREGMSDWAINGDCAEFVVLCQSPATASLTASPPALKDAWYFLDAASDPQGPLPARQVSLSAGLEAYYVWREGMGEWVVNRDCEDFRALCQPPPAANLTGKEFHGTKTMAELVGLCRGLIADNKITTAEVIFLNSWLQDAGFIAEWPASEIAHTMERILEDGVVTKAEKEELKKLLQKITGESSRPAAPPSGLVSSVESLSQASATESFAYTTVRLEQGTPEWLEWRHKGIGASDAPVIMGENPWKSAPELLAEKRGVAKEVVPNAAMARGTRLEPEARKRYVSRRHVDVQPACLQSSQHEWLRASVDGISADSLALVEIKCGDSVYRKTSEDGCVPDYYYGELQHILAVTGLQSIDFWCYLPGLPELLVPVERDDKYINRLINAEFKFWKNVLRSA